MVNLKEYIEESLLDDFDDLSNALNGDVIKKWCDDHLQGKYNLTILKKSQEIRLYGDVVIKGITDEKIPITISVLSGSLSIEKCPNLTSLDGLFKEFMTLQGNLSINNSHSLPQSGIRSCFCYRGREEHSYGSDR